MAEYPKYEKVDDNTIRIIVEKADNVSLSKLIETKKAIEAKLIQLQTTLDNINEILKNAEKMGIVAKEKDRDTKND
jgi:hypothetical protein